MSFRIVGLPLEPFRHLLDADPDTLRKQGVILQIVDEPHSAPCRVTLEDAEVGEEVLLLSYRHMDAVTPYAASGPIFVRRKARRQFEGVGVIPDQQRRRLLSVRAYDAQDMLVESEVVAGADLEPLIERFFSNPSTAYLHVHNARPGCFACRVEQPDSTASESRNGGLEHHQDERRDRSRERDHPPEVPRSRESLVAPPVRSAALCSRAHQLRHARLQGSHAPSEHDPREREEHEGPENPAGERSGSPPTMAAPKPPITITTTPGIVNTRSLPLMPSSVWAMSRASRVRSAWRFQ